MVLGTIFVLYGPSASGKTEIQRHLTTDHLFRIITVTTRPPREHEIHSIHYIFTDKKQFKQGVADNQFVEWTQYNGEFYGTLKSSVEEIITGDQNAVIILDIAGVRALKSLYNNVTAIFIGADLESLQRRLENRNMSRKELTERLNKAKFEELSEPYLNLADAIVWNSDETPLEQSIHRVQTIISHGVSAE
ncbi:guanylate kinase [Paenibacillus uliginis N3/975]|uniref:Guanylate kinase n=1 Tax=Paenibacillus uliginis N3/975 TaxID=1313296 RepID=A0A1X7HRQ1_9BACL|nr:guanylate kinase [Paenibacillus uliginis]SMF91772.1 guanylate kinase [Paenibacillus uliginis N3/975]